MLCGVDCFHRVGGPYKSNLPEIEKFEKPVVSPRPEVSLFIEENGVNCNRSTEYMKLQ